MKWLYENIDYNEFNDAIKLCEQIIMDDAKIEGFGTELFDQLIEGVIEETGAQYLEFELWNQEDKSKIIFEEAGYDMANGIWEYEN